MPTYFIVAPTYPRGARPRSVEERFWSHVQKTDTCWIWTGCVHPSGHGQMSVRTVERPNKHLMAAHRISWVLRHGLIDAGLCVLHNCPGGDNPACVNPDHLYLGTRAVNNADAARKGQTARDQKLPHSRLQLAQVQEIRRRHAAGGVTMGALAREFGVNQSNISRIIHHQRRLHVV